MATAFEMFFRLPRENKTKLFSEKLESLLRVDSYAVYDKNYNVLQTGLTRTTKTDGRGKTKCHRGNIPINLTVYGWWAREFYNLRSKIVHDGLVQASDLNNHTNSGHLRIALRILLFCFFELLVNKGYYVLDTDPAGNRIALRLEQNDFRKIEKIL